MVGKRLAAPAGAQALAGTGAIGLAGPAHAQDDCRTVTSTLVDRPDSTVENDTWALDEMTRAVEICQVEPGAYHAQISDTGIFVTQALDHTPAGADQALPAGVTGAVEGGFTADFSATPDWASFDASHLDDRTIHGADHPSSTWVESMFGADFDGSSLNDDWSWTYTTCREQWVNQTGTLGGNQGDITGEPCPEVTAAEGSSCEAVTLNFDNPTNVYFSGDYRIDGEDGTADDWSGATIEGEPHDGEPYGLRYNTVDLPPDAQETVELEFDPGTGQHTIAYRIWRGGETDWYVPWGETVVDCGEPEPTPGDDNGEAGGLPVTGGQAGTMAAVALGLLALGTVLYITGRRRRVTS